MGHSISISEAAMKFGISLMTISGVCRECRIFRKTSNLRDLCGRKKTVSTHRRLMRSLKRDRRATVPQIVSDFNAGASVGVCIRTVPFVAKGTVNDNTTQLMTGNALLDLMSLVSNYIGRIYKYGYGDTLMNPWRLLVSRELVKLCGGPVMVWGVCSWRYTKALQTTLTGDKNVRILSYHLYTHSCPLCIQKDLDNFCRTMRVALFCRNTRRELLRSVSSDFRHFSWPLNPLDININDYIWGALQHYVQKTLQTIVDSRRVAALLRARRSSTP